jgi:hypothetical protein
MVKVAEKGFAGNVAGEVHRDVDAAYKENARSQEWLRYGNGE